MNYQARSLEPACLGWERVTRKHFGERWFNQTQVTLIMTCVCVCAFVCARAHACVCVREREKERECVSLITTSLRAILRHSVGLI